MAHKTAFAGFSYLAGLLIASFFAFYVSFGAGSVLLCAGLGIIFIIRPSKSGRLYRGAFCAAACSAGIFLYCGYELAVYMPIISNSGRQLDSPGVICSAPESASDRIFYIAMCTLPDGRRAKVGFFGNDTGLMRGDSLTLKGTLYIPENKSFFASKDYYRTQNVFLFLRDADADNITVNEKSIYRKADKFRERAVSAIKRYIPSEEGELLAGMIFGNGFSDISDKTKELMYKAGIGHVTSVSGMHMSIVCSVTAAMLSAAGIPKKIRPVLIAAAAFLFALAADFSVSVIRSMIMVIIVYSADFFNRRGDSAASLGAAIIIITCTSPFIASNASFMLSVMGVFGSAVLAPCLIEAVQRKINEKRNETNFFRAGDLFISVITAVCAAAAVFPVSALTFDEISVISPVSNIILSPFCSAAAALGIAGAAISAVPFLTPLSSGFFIAGALLCKPVLFLSEKIGSLPFAAVPAGLEIIPPIMVIIAASAAAAVLIINDKFFSVLLCVFSVFTAVCMINVYMLVPEEHNTIAVLSEGNGCAVVVSSGGKAYIYDFSGSKRCADAAQSYIKRSGAGQVGFVMLSQKNGSMEAVYLQKFPKAAIISENGKSGLTYSSEDNIIKVGEFEIIPCKGYTIIRSAEGWSIICVSGEGSPPVGECFGLVVLNGSCSENVFVNGSVYAVTDKDFKGRLHPSASCLWCTSGEYTAYGSEIHVKEEPAWLR